MEPITELVLVAEGTVEPLSVVDAKLWLRVDTDDEDDLLASLCAAARNYAEIFCRRSFKTGDVWELSLSSFPRAYFRDAVYFNQPVSEFWGSELDYLTNRPEAFAIKLPMGPVTAIGSVKYIDGTGATQTLDPSLYTLILDQDANPRLYPAYGTWWPLTEIRPDAVTITFTTGGTPPPLVLTAIKQILAHWYANREGVVITSSTAQEVPLLANRLLWPYRQLEFGS